MRSFKIIKIYAQYGSYDTDDISFVMGNIHWEQCEDDEFNELIHGIQLLNNANKYSPFIYGVIEKPDDKQHQDLIDLSLQGVKDWKKAQETLLLEKQKQLAKQKEQRRLKAEERKRKQFEKLKQELGEG